MSIIYDDGRQAIAKESRRVLAARSNLQRLLQLLEPGRGYDELFWATAVEQGWTALSIPEEHGGLGLGLLELGLIAQAAGAATSGAPFLTTGDAAAQALQLAESADLKARWLPAIGSGEAKAAIAFAEGSIALSPRAGVTFSRGKLVGLKKSVTAGQAADLAIVWALSDDQPVLVLAELEPTARAPVGTFDNSRLIADLEFADTPATALVKGAGATSAALDILARMAVVTAHEQVGGAEALLEEGRAYAMTRKAFGQPIAAFQSVKHRLAELYALVELARANAIHAASREGRSDFVKAAAAARLSATEAYDTAARDVIQIHGGIGVTWEAGLHLHMRRARSLALECGNTLFWEDVLVEQLTGVPA